MNKKLDQLIKLVALANNNPNENEANSAARKACRIFSEIKWNFKDSNGNNTKTNYNPQTDSRTYRSSPFDDLFRNMWGGRRSYSSYYEGTWPGFDRTTEPEFKSKPPNPEPSKTGWNPFDPFRYADPFEKQIRRDSRFTNELITKTCTECNKEFQTQRKDRTVCVGCEWTIYNKIKKKKPEEKKQHQFNQMTQTCRQCGMSQAEYYSNPANNYCNV